MKDLSIQLLREYISLVGAPMHILPTTPTAQSHPREMSATWLSVLARTEYFSIGLPSARRVRLRAMCFAWRSASRPVLVASFPSISTQAQSPMAKILSWAMR